MIDGYYYNLSSDGDKKQMTNIAPIIRELKSLSEAVKGSVSDEMSIDNLVEVKLHLRTELSTAVKKITDALHILTIPEKKVDEKLLNTLTDAVKEVKDSLNKINFTPTVNVEPPVIPEIKLPQINVPTPQVTVNPDLDIDFSELKEYLKPLQYITNDASKPISVRSSDGKSFVRAIEKANDKMIKVMGNAGGGMTQDEFRSTQRTYEDPLIRYKVANVDDDGTPNYYGYVNITGGWYIMKEIISVGADTYRYSSGTANFVSNWAGRTVLTYSYLYEVSF